ncbi:hypothetical protein [Streptomyces sp. NPDC096013]|uniref:hypothetical protein n=1 Tax=Streptomyces sp. NPDC096013 TaxID=3366069 RepID=UPI0037F7BDF7
MCSDQDAPIKTKAVKVSPLPYVDPGGAFAQASRFRDDLFACLTARGDELFTPADVTDRNAATHAFFRLHLMHPEIAIV